MRLIDADELSEAIHENVLAMYEESVAAKEDCLREIEEAPTVNTVVVTRCKDCRYRGLICCPAIHETMGNGLVDCTVDNGYCWCGKPKEA